MELSFSISSIKAILLSDDEDNIIYNDFFKNDSPSQEYITAFDLDYIPVLERRRLGKASKSVMSILQSCEEPIVFTSYRGEINRSLDLLFDLARTNAISPTSFSLSVLNATAAVASIMHKNHSEITAISAFPALENGFIQAYINLQSNDYNKIMLLSYYEGENKEYYKIDTSFYALAIMVEKGDDIRLTRRVNKSDEMNNFNSSLYSELLFLDNYKKRQNYSFNLLGYEWSYFFK